jgi:putative DNA primase/helicase
MANLAGREVRFLPEEGSYRQWNGAIWEKADANNLEMKLYCKLLRSMAEDVSLETDTKTMYRKLSAIESAKKARRTQETLNLFRKIPTIRRSRTMFDAHHDLVPCNNGTYDLSLQYWYPPFSWDLQHRHFDVTYDKDATCPAWKNFIVSVTAGDSTLQTYLQMVTGYLLSGGNPLEKMFLIYGPAATGKTTYIVTIQKLFGTFVRKTTISTFTEKSSKNALASLQGTRLVIIDENDGEESGHLSSALLKQVVSGEPVEARFLYHEFFEFDVTFKILNATNYLPSFKVFDDALRRRLIVVPFENQIPETQRDPGLKIRLQAELPGILNWAIQGWQLVKKYGLQTPFALQQRLYEYGLNFNSIERFLRSACLRVEGSEVSSTELYQIYRGYCKAHGEGSPMKHKSFSMRMNEAGVRSYRSSHGIRYVGIRLRDFYRLADEWGVLPEEITGGYR